MTNQSMLHTIHLFYFGGFRVNPINQLAFFNFCRIMAEISGGE